MMMVKQLVMLCDCIEFGIELWPDVNGSMSTRITSQVRLLEEYAMKTKDKGERILKFGVKYCSFLIGNKLVKFFFWQIYSYFL